MKMTISGSGKLLLRKGHARPISARSQSTILAMLAALSFIFGFMIDAVRFVDQFLFCEIVAFLLTLFGLLLKNKQFEPSHQYLSKIVFTMLFAAIFFSLLLINGDSLDVAFNGAAKWIIFFITCLTLLYIPGHAVVVMTWTAAFSLGMVSYQLLDGIPLFFVAKYVIAPLYVLGLNLLHLRNIKDAVPLKLTVSALFIVAMYGAIFGGYRGATLGTFLVLTTVLLCGIGEIAKFSYTFRRPISFLIAIATGVIPAVFVLLVPLERVQRDYATKSNIERTASITFALRKIEERPFTGQGAGHSFLDSQKIFAKNLGGFEATSSIHNQALDVALFAGVPMSIAFCVLYSLLFLRMLNMSTVLVLTPLRSARAAGPARFSFSSAAFGSIAAIAAIMSVAPFASSTRCMIILAICSFATLYYKSPIVQDAIK